MRRPMQTSMLSGKLRVFPFVQADGHPPGGDDRLGRCAGVLCVADVGRVWEIKAGQKYRLPTDAEWSVAVGLGKERGNTPREKSGLKKGGYPWGNYGPPRKGAGNYFGSLKVDKFYYTSPAGSFAANKLGLHDMGGNVWEWCEDWYDPSEKKYRVWRGPCIVDLNPSS